MKENILPSKFNFKLKAEWESHEATWIGWPQNKEDWPGKFSPIQWVYGEIVRKIAEGEIVRILVNNKKIEDKALRVLEDVNANINNVEFYHFKSNRGWLRDSGPAFIRNEEDVALVNFKFNAWAKYKNFQKDQKLPSFISEELDIMKFDAIYNGKKVVLEGGSIDYNGQGSLLTTEECLLDQDFQVRNPGFTKKDYENVFKDYLGINNVIWLNRGIMGDDTHGHVDDICRFVKKDTVVLAVENDEYDLNYEALQENKERLQDAVLEDGSKLNVVELPMPAHLSFKNERLPASYTNFYISNSAVLVPVFNDPKDRVALNKLQDIFTDRPVCGISAVDLVWGFGTLHCLTHEQPK